jgi:hypothetical protein
MHDELYVKIEAGNLFILWGADQAARIQSKNISCETFKLTIVIKCSKAGYFITEV